MSAQTEDAPKRKRHYSQETLDKRAARVAERRQARIEDIEHLTTYDNNAEAVARRAGFTNAETAVRWLMRVGRHDLAARMHPFIGNKDIYHRDYRSNTRFGSNAGGPQ